MANYYYFVPSLPSIKSDSSSFMTVDDFLALCRTKISKRDYKMLEKTVNGSDVVHGNDFVTAYTKFRNDVNTELAWQRSQKLGIKSDEYVHKANVPLEVSSAVSRAVNDSDPLEGEKILLSLYFRFLDRNVGFGHQWDLTFLISYALKLQLLAKRSSYSAQKGRAEFDSLFSTLRNEIFR